MRNKLRLTGLFILLSFLTFSQGAWMQLANYPPPGRQSAVGFSLGQRGYYAFGGGSDDKNSADMTEYNPFTNTWAKKAKFPGRLRQSSHVFVIDSLAYFVGGGFYETNSHQYICFNDVWAYNPDKDSWKQLRDFPGTPRRQGGSFSYAGKGYFGLGISSDLQYLHDFWEYNPATDTWTQKAGFPGAGRKDGLVFNLSRNGYVGLGSDSTATALNDIWKYDVLNNSWSRQKNFPGDPCCGTSYLSINNKGYMITGHLLNASADTKQCWEYNPGADTWTALPDFPGPARSGGAAFSLNGRAYVGLGSAGTYLNDFWMYIPNTGPERRSPEKISIRAYPDPATDWFEIEVSNLPENENEISIIDIIGRNMMTTKIDWDPQTFSIDCSSWKQGEYFIVLQSGLSKFVKSVTIK